MTFAKHLTQLVEHAKNAGREQLESSLRSFASTVSETLSGDWSEYDRNELIQDAEDAGEGAIWLDAAACAEKLGLADAAEVVDVTLGQRLRPGDLVAEATEQLQPAGLARKGFVFVLWTPNPEDYALVGYATTASELKQVPAQAIADSELLSLVVPERGGKKQLLALCSSIVHLIRCSTDADPTYNEDVDPEMPDSPAWDRIKLLSDLLEDAGVLLYNRAHTGED